MPIGKHSFIQMSKLTNVKGRITYISSKAKQENLYSVYETTERRFWRELANYNQEEFVKSGTDGTCIEARELIIALPPSFVDYQPDMLLKLFTEHFRQNYGTECISALHHNKRKTNYHIHLIFAERKLLEEPTVKIATRNMYYDENGKHVRTKKEVTGEDGTLRNGCSVIKKGEVYERNIFTKKDERFKTSSFLEEVKHSYTDLINIYLKEDEQKFKVFDQNGIYLSTKKIGKNNPKAEVIKVDNEVREKWNHTVDRALIAGVPETQIAKVKKTEIGEKARESIQTFGKNPSAFRELVQVAITALELLIKMIFEKILKKEDSVVVKEVDPIEKTIIEEPKEPRPVKSGMAARYPVFQEAYEKLYKQNYAINKKKDELEDWKKQLANTTGIFKGKRRKELQEIIESVENAISNMERRLPAIVHEYGYNYTREFMRDYNIAKREYEQYEVDVKRWERGEVAEEQPRSIRERLRQAEQRQKEICDQKKRDRVGR